jgi:hypothetical protein
MNKAIASDGQTNLLRDVQILIIHSNHLWDMEELKPGGVHAARKKDLNFNNVASRRSPLRYIVKTVVQILRRSHRYCDIGRLHQL